MIERLKHILFAEGRKGKAPRENADLELAAAALLVEAAVLDGDFDAAERATIERLLSEHYNLNPSEVRALLQEAESAVAESNELYTFTRTIKDRMPLEERVSILEMLWEVALADGEIHAYESNLVRRLAGLLYVSDRDSGEARKRVLARLGMEPTS